MRRAFENLKLILPDLGPLLSGMPHPRVILRYHIVREGVVFTLLDVALVMRER
jgi:hypothetical protein